jgi:hypothetical protein
MRKAVIKLTILTIILLVSIGSTVLGNPSYATNSATNSAINVIGESTVTNTANVAVANVAVVETEVQTTHISTPKEVAVTGSTSPQATSVQKEPAQTSKSPGLGFVVSVVVFLSAIYIGKRK